MAYNKKEKDLLDNINDFEQSLRLRGSINSKTDIKKSSNIFEQLGFTTSINSEIKLIEGDRNIKIISPFTTSQRSNMNFQSDKFGFISPHDLNEKNFNPSLKRIKFINRFILIALLFAIIVNFILFFI